MRNSIGTSIGIHSPTMHQVVNPLTPKDHTTLLGLLQGAGHEVEREFRSLVWDSARRFFVTITGTASITCTYYYNHVEWCFSFLVSMDSL